MRLAATDSSCWAQAAERTNEAQITAKMVRRSKSDIGTMLAKSNQSKNQDHDGRKLFEKADNALTRCVFDAGPSRPQSVQKKSYQPHTFTVFASIHRYCRLGSKQFFSVEQDLTTCNRPNEGKYES